MQGIILNRLSASYSGVEDRISLLGEGRPGECVDMWLTQRLLNLVVSHLVQLLEAKVAKDLPFPSTPASPSALSSKGSNTSHVNLAEQRFAADSFKNLVPVKVQSSSSKWLIHTIDIVSSRNMVRLIFKGVDRAASIEFDTVALRQWVQVLYKLCEQAKWQTISWPAWVISVAQPSTKVPLQ
jgi:hypothetical protein